MKKLRKLISKKRKQMNRSVTLASVLGAILVISAIFALTVRQSNETPADPIDSEEGVAEIDTADLMPATVTYIEGTVEHKTDDEWEPAEKDFAVTPGTSIRTTGAASRSIVTLDDGSEVRVDASSEILFESLTTARVVIVHSKGHLYSRVVPSDSRTYVVSTQNAQFESVGTAFRTSASGDEESVEAFENEVKETINNANAKQGEKLIVKSFVNPSKNNTVEGLNIETLKDDSFISWNRELDTQNDAFKDKLGFLSDITGPNITVVSPGPGSSIDVDEQVTQGQVVISGTTERGAKLTVESKSQPGSSPVTVSVDGSGNFTTSSLSAPLGTSVFEFVSTDRIGNKTVLNVNYAFNKKTTTQQETITLSVNKDDPDEFKFGWILDGLTTPDGVRLIYDNSSGPTYEKNDGKKTIKTGNSVDFSTSSLKKGQSYYFKVCRYLSDEKTCDVYSNQVKVTIE